RVKSWCLTPAAVDGQITDALIDELRTAKIETLVVLAPAGGESEWTAFKHAARLAAAGIAGTTIKLAHLPAGSRPGASLADAWIELEYSEVALQAFLRDLPTPKVEPAPPDGFYRPEGTESLVWPAGFVWSRTGVFKNARNRRTGEATQDQITIGPVWIARRYGQVDGSDTALELTMELQKRRISHVVAASEIASASKIPLLADRGFLGFSSERASAIIEYLTAFLAANLATLPTAVTTTTVGTSWESKAEAPVAFVHGGHRYLRDGTSERVQVSPASHIPEARFNAFATRGTAEGWAAILPLLRERGYRTPYTMILAAVASPLNRYLDHAMPFIVQAGGEAAGGKTESLKLAMSTQGPPARYSSMRSTTVAIEVNLGLHNDLALCADELHSYQRGARQPDALEDLTYAITEPDGKDRGSRQGGLRVRSLRSGNAIFTGELELASVTSTGNTGIRTRIISLFGEPFGGRTEQTARDIGTLNAITAAHYGHAVPLIGRYLLSLTPAGVAALRERYQQKRQVYITGDKPEGVDLGMVGRAAEMFARLELAGELLAQLLPATAAGPGADVHRMLEPVWQKQLERLRVAGRAERALDAVRRFVAQRAGDFEGVETATWKEKESRGEMPVRGSKKVGRLSEDGKWIAILDEELSLALVEAGFSLAVERAHWKQKGWIYTDPNGVASYKTRVNKVQVRTVAVKRSVLDDLDGNGAPKQVEQGQLPLEHS
ncbi:MAG TPA: DUF927 domain-containing protein, partial [Solirubrobacterales bacterium]|nr:DUF927 domain-containing protein [Solirubrobacterales bacterium]